MKKQIARLIAAGALTAAAMVPAAAAHADYGNAGGGGGSGDPGSGGGQSGNNGGTLPFTGGDVIGITLLGAGLAAGGTILVRANRRKSQAY